MGASVRDDRFDVIVVGGGHAGCEAANAAARLGADTLLVTGYLSRVGQMSCNPAIGGVAKGTVAREVDALGGIMGRAADRTCLHFRMLNRSKGPAVWAPRAQCDRGLYPRAVRSLLEERRGLATYQGMVSSLILEGGRVRGVECADDSRFRARNVVLATGTFLRGAMRMGTERSISGGRAGDPPSLELAEQLLELDLEVGRFKTGTPPRVDGRTVDREDLERQEGDHEGRFSHWEERDGPGSRPCWITWAGPGAKEVVEENLDRSAMYGGAIGAKGPRYCPSIEDKVVRFPETERHQVFLEPEGLETEELYVNGLSTSLPPDVQRELLRRVPGLGEARMTQPGYAIEYDYFPPEQLDRTLRLEPMPGMYFAGQINGTTGYEEAAAQGIVAGINAALEASGREPWVPARDEAYIGVLVDDLVTKGVDEPYRLFTSRAEFRLLLRQDNCLQRLGTRARDLGLLDEGELRTLEGHLEDVERARSWVEEYSPEPESVNGYLEDAGTSTVDQKRPMEELAARPQVSLTELADRDGDVETPGVSEEALTVVEMEIKYAGYIEKERERASKLRQREEMHLPPDADYSRMESLSTESREKLDRVRPETLGQAGRIPGVSPADLQSLVVEVKKRRG